MKLPQKLYNLLLTLACICYLPFRGTAKTPKKEQDHVLVVRWKRHVGDTVYITPLFRAIKKTFPNARLTVLGQGRVGEVIAHNPDIDEYIEHNGKLLET